MAYVGLVCEGETDFIALKVITQTWAKKKGLGDITIKCLQPNPDASSRPQGGWTRVIGWCRRYAGEPLKKLFEVPAFDGEPMLTHLMVHIDGDALDLVKGASTLVLPSVLTSTIEQVAQLVAHELKNDTELCRRIIFAIPVQSIEAWILAGLVDDELDFDLVDAKSEYRRRFEIGKKGSRREKFIAAATHAAHAGADRLMRSPSYAHFCTVEVSKLAA